jgi:hypothetical protein
MNAKTKECLEELKRACAAGQTLIAPSIFSHCYGRGATAAAFRIAKAEGLIEVDYIGGTGTPVYKPATPKAAAPAPAPVKLCPVCGQDCEPVRLPWLGGYACRTQLAAEGELIAGVTVH